MYFVRVRKANEPLKLIASHLTLQAASRKLGSYIYPYGRNYASDLMQGYIEHNDTKITYQQARRKLKDAIHSRRS